LHSNLLDTAGRDCPTKKKDPRHPKAARARQGGNKKKKQGGPRTRQGYPPHATSFLDIKKKSFINTPLKEN